MIARGWVSLDEPGRARLVVGGCVAAFVLLGLVAILFGPNSAGRIQDRVAAAAGQALAASGHTTMNTSAHGRWIELSGLAPDEAARADAVARVSASLGSGGFLAGAVEGVRTQGVDLAAMASPYRFRVERVADRVSVGGHVPSRDARATVQQAAKALFGDGADVSLELAIGAPTGVNWTLASIAAMEAVRRLESGYAELTDDSLAVTGVAADAVGARELADRLMRIGSALPVVFIDVVGPADWSATWEAGRLAIAGKVASVGAKRALVGAAQLPFGAVTDESAVFESQPDDGWGRVAVAALPHLVKFDRGRIAVHGSLVRITGEAPGSVLVYLREDVEAAANGAPVDILARESAVTVDGLDVTATASATDQGREACEQAFARVMDGNTVVFATRTARISRASGAALDRLVEVARRCEAFAITVEGHTDDRGRRAANLTLSQQRAQAVVDYMIARGIPVDRLSAIGLGPDQPKSSNRTSSGRAANRRIEFRVSTGGGR